MPAANTDKFTKVGSPGTATSLAAPGHTIGGTSINVLSTANWDTTTGVIFAMDQVTIVNGESVRVDGTYTEWEGVVTGATTIASMTLKYGSDQNYSAGATTRVYIPVASSRENQIIDAILEEHKNGADSGKHSDITADSVTTDTISGTTDADTGTVYGVAVTNGVITTPAVVGPSVRTGGFKIGTIAGSSVLNTTGNKAITGVGFTPKLVRFTTLSTANATISTSTVGAMTTAAQFYASTYSTATPTAGRMSGTDACIANMSGPSTQVLKAAYVSMDADGFTINVATASNAADVAYEAYA